MKKTVLFVLFIWGFQANAFSDDLKDIVESLKNSFVYEGIRYHRLSDSTVEVGCHLDDWIPNDVLDDLKVEKMIITGDVVIPSTVNDGEHEYTVTGVGLSAFSWNYLTSITLPSTINKISKGAFTYNLQLKEISLSDGLESIGDAAFCHCSSLTEIVIPKTVTSIGGEAFSGCSSLEKVTLPPNITKIDYSTFQSCAFSNISLPSGITEIGNAAFWGCRLLEEIELPEGLETIGATAFQNCANLRNVYFPPSLQYIGFCAFSFNMESQPKCNRRYYFSNDSQVPLKIDFRAFESSQTDTIVLPKNVREIGEKAFFMCKTNYLSIPNGILEIGNKAFHFTELQTVVSYLDNLSVYKTQAVPSLFAEDVPQHCKLYVPDILVDMYKNNIEWQDFIIIPMEDEVVTGTSSMSVDRSFDATTRYDMSGRRIDRPKRGINIVETSNGKRRKVMVK